MTTIQEKKQTGFTMIELLVAIGIFGIFITIITGVFSRFMLIERHGIAEGQLLSDLQSSMEAFIKEARTSYGSTYDVTGSTGNNEVSFVNQDGNCVAFRVNGGVFQRADIGSVATCDPGAFTPNKFSPLTGSQTNISAIHFNIVPAQVVNNKLANQGVITINMTAQSASSDVLPIQLENTIVSRQMNPYVQQ